MAIYMDDHGKPRTVPSEKRFDNGCCVLLEEENRPVHDNMEATPQNQGIVQAFLATFDL
jgi:hypothetical protein